MAERLKELGQFLQLGFAAKQLGTHVTPYTCSTAFGGVAGSQPLPACGMA